MKRVECPLWVGSEVLGVLFTSEGRIDKWISATSAVMQALYQSAVVKRALSQKARLSVYWSVFVPTLTCGYVTTDRKNEITDRSG